MVADMAEDVYKAMNMLGVSSAFVYGVSQGGMITDPCYQTSNRTISKQ